MKNQNNFLQETLFDFTINKELSQEDAVNFLQNLAKLIDLEITFIKFNVLPPGWDVLVGIKTSCMYLGYWPEYNYVHLIVSSCKAYDEKKISQYITETFDITPLVTEVTNAPISNLLALIRNLNERSS